MKRVLAVLVLALVLPSALAAQASPFAHLRGPALRGLKEATLYINVAAPGTDADLLYADIQDTAVAMLAREGMTLRRGIRNGAVAIFPALFLELVTIPVGPDSVRVAASIVLIEAAQTMRLRTYSPGMTWGVRNWPIVSRDRLLPDAAIPLLHAFIHDWRCGSGQLGICDEPGVPR
ncbi:MAG TPA: hypothetical protein VL295_01935 [Gemmatimonadales bacterium]|nr:hypothetical protein [Gemmatimonadales bacterium]